MSSCHISVAVLQHGLQYLKNICIKVADICRSDAPPTLVFYSICLTPDDFTCHVESAATQWVNKLPMHPLKVAMHPDAPYFSILLVKWRVLPLKLWVNCQNICKISA